jgi:hypothetical protein
MHLSVVLWDERPGRRSVGSGSHANKLGEEKRMGRDLNHAGGESTPQGPAHSPP